MAMSLALLFILYAFFATLWILKGKSFKAWGLSPKFILLLFFLRLGLGAIYGQLHLEYFDAGDTYLYFEESQRIAQTLWPYWDYYWGTWTGQAAIPPPEADVYLYPDWTFIRRDFGTYALVHIHAIPQLFSAKSYLLHSFFVAFLGLFASLNFYWVLRRHFQLPTRLLQVACFFMPSILFWTAGLHKDVWVYLSISGLLLGLDAYYRQLWKRALSFLGLGLLGLAIFRTYLLGLVFPALMAATLLPFFFKNRPARAYLSVYVVLGLGLFALEMTGYFSPLEVLANRQGAFLAEKGGSVIANASGWEPNFYSFLSYLPDALFNVCFRPLIWNVKDSLQLAAAFEILFFWLLFFLGLSKDRRAQKRSPIFYFMFFYALTNLLLIGLLVVNLGTIVRYRSIALHFLVILLLQSAHFLNQYFQSKESRKKPLGPKTECPAASPTAELQD